MDISPQPKKDLRIDKTQRALTGALFTLLEKNVFHKITVNDICETALISRTAFYFHFEDKYHLLRFALSEFKCEALGKDYKTNPKNALMDLLRLTKENGKIYKNLIITENSHELLKIMMEIFTIDFIDAVNLSIAMGYAYNMPVNIAAVYKAGGVSHLLMWWLSTDCEIPTEEMATYLMELAFKAE